MFTPSYYANTPNFLQRPPAVAIPQDWDGKQYQYPRPSRQQRRARHRGRGRGHGSKYHNQPNWPSDAARRQFEQQQHLIGRLDVIWTILLAALGPTDGLLTPLPTAAATGNSEPRSARANDAWQQGATCRIATPVPHNAHLPQTPGLQSAHYPSTEASPGAGPSSSSGVCDYDFHEAGPRMQRDNVRDGADGSSEPSPMIGAAAATPTTREILHLLGSAFDLLEMDLVETRRRLQELRAAAAAAADRSDIIRSVAVGAVADNLEFAIEMNLDRIHLLHAAQRRAGLRSPFPCQGSPSGAEWSGRTAHDDGGEASLGNVYTTPTPSSRYGGRVDLDCEEDWTYVRSHPAWSMLGGESTTTATADSWNVAGRSCYLRGERETVLPNRPRLVA